MSKEKCLVVDLRMLSLFPSKMDQNVFCIDDKKNKFSAIYSGKIIQPPFISGSYINAFFFLHHILYFRFVDIRDVIYAIEEHPDMLLRTRLKIGSVACCINPNNIYLFGK